MGVVRSRARERGGRLSNTWLTYPEEGDNPGKLGIISHRRGVLERFLAERLMGYSPLMSASGWGCGPSGSWGGGKGPPSL